MKPMLILLIIGIGFCGIWYFIMKSQESKRVEELIYLMRTNNELLQQNQEILSRMQQEQLNFFSEMERSGKGTISLAPLTPQAMQWKELYDDAATEWWRKNEFSLTTRIQLAFKSQSTFSLDFTSSKTGCVLYVDDTYEDVTLPSYFCDVTKDQAQKYQQSDYYPIKSGHICGLKCALAERLNSVMGRQELEDDYRRTCRLSFSTSPSLILLGEQFMPLQRVRDS